MRLMLATFFVASAVAPLALAQTSAPTAPAATPSAPPPAAATMTPTPVPAPATTPSPPPPSAAPAPAPAVQPTPPPPTPPPPVTDPVALELMATLENVCIPAVEGGDLQKLAKQNGYRKENYSYELKRKGYQFTIRDPGSNPTQCHVDMIHPVYAEAPAAPMVIALHQWAVDQRDWTLYRNDKSVDANGQLLTTRSWNHDVPGKHEAMFITTYRHADGTPLHHDQDDSTFVYSETPTSS